MARRKNAYKANVSFFAFQDIITAVSGILILIVILMVLMLKQPGLIPTSLPKTTQLSLGELDQLIADSHEKIRKIEILKRKTAGVTQSELKAQIEKLKSSLDSDETPQGKALRLELQAALEELEIVKKEASIQEAEKDRIEGEVDQIRGKIQTKADDLAASENSAQIWLHKGTTSKEPMIIDVHKDKFIVVDLQNPNNNRTVSGNEMTTEFNKLIQGANKSTSYFVFFVRPDSVLRFKAFRTIAVRGNFDIGYTPIKQDAEIKVSPN